MNLRRIKQQRFLKSTISFFLYEVMRETRSFFSVGEYRISAKNDSLKIYLFFVDENESNEIIDLLERKYLHLLKKRLLKTKKLSKIPWISFLKTDPVIFLSTNESFNIEEKQ